MRAVSVNFTRLLATLFIYRTTLTPMFLGVAVVAGLDATTLHESELLERELQQDARWAKEPCTAGINNCLFRSQI